MRLKCYFGPDNPPPEKPPFKQRSTWQPPPAFKPMEDYLAELPHKLDNLPRTKIRPNLTKDEWKALNQLSRNNSIVIKRADKGSCVVVEERKKYIEEGLKHLADKDIYLEIESDYTPDIAKAINVLAKKHRAKGHLTEDMEAHLTNPKPEETRTQQLYFLKKIHKDPHGVRPIVSGVSGPTERASEFVDHYLQPLVTKTASYIKDSTSIIRLLEERSFQPQTVLATIDVRSLYLNIPHEQGIEAALEHLFGPNNPSAEELPFPPEFIRALLNAILKNNIFEFNSAMYKQIQGTAMGTKMAPAYANLFMDDLESKFLQSRILKPSEWWRFIDDIVCFWEHPSEDLQIFLNDFNNNHSTIKLTWEVSDYKVIFLDLEILKGTRFRDCGKFDITIHFKETNKFQYLPWNSAHPRPTHRGIVKGEFIRVLRACSDEETFKANKRKLSRHLQQRGYPINVLEDISNSIPFKDRDLHLQDKPKETEQPPAFVCNYNPQINTKELKEALQPPIDELQPRICYKRNKNLSNHIVRARLAQTDKPPRGEKKVALKNTLTWRLNSAPCGKKNCVCCGFMSGKDTIFESNNIRAHRGAEGTNCDTSNVIYIIECNKCKRQNQYVGQTRRPLRERLSGHRAAYLQHKNMPIYRHFWKPGHSLQNMKVTVLEKVKEGEDIEERERDWMRKLRTTLPQGLNSQFSLN